MEKYTLKINSSKGILSVSWSDVAKLAEYASLQSGLYGGMSDTITRSLFDKHFVDWTQRQWNHREQLGAVDLPDNAVIIDVGSGIAVQDLLLYSYLSSSKIYLLDKEECNFQNGIYFSEDYPFYNSWTPVIDAIETSNFDKSRFEFLNSNSPWPEADCITSYYSWCFHYPKETYWDKCLSSLKKGGKLVLDIRLIHNRNIVEEISEELRSHPTVFEYVKTIPKWIDDYQGPDPNVLGHRCVWIKNS